MKVKMVSYVVLLLCVLGWGPRISFGYQLKRFNKVIKSKVAAKATATDTHSAEVADTGLVAIAEGHTEAGALLEGGNYKPGSEVDDATIAKHVHVLVYNEKHPKGAEILDEKKPEILDVYTTFYTHGYNDNGGSCLKFVDAYVKLSKMKVKKKRTTPGPAAGDKYQVVCVDWKVLAAPAGSQSTNKKNWGVYDGEAKKAVDVGTWLGKELNKVKELPNSKKLHFIGHSLGAHLSGNMARTYNKESGQKIDRVTGLDPAGPVFNVNKHGLKASELRSDDADFVDVIHTNGAMKSYAASTRPRFGDLNRLGHADFYPNGGSLQPCGHGIPVKQSICSHGAANMYYVESITKRNKFKSEKCIPEEKNGAMAAAFGDDSTGRCWKPKAGGWQSFNQMGEFATRPKYKESKGGQTREKATMTYFLEATPVWVS